MKYFLLLYFVSNLLIGKIVEPSSIDQKIIFHTFNEEYEQAKNLSHIQIKQNPNSPKYYYYVINVRILEYYQKVSELDSDKRDAGRKALNKELIEYCENVIDKFDDTKHNLENKFYFGTIYGYLARVYGMDGSWWSAFRAGLKAKSTMEEIIKVDPLFYDAYLVLGMLNYYADRMSGITSFIAGVLGFSGNRETGLNQLKLAYEKGKLAFGQSALTLIEVYSSLEDNKLAALSYYEDFLRRFPNNKRILSGYCQTLMSLWELEKVETIIKDDKQNLVDDYTMARFYDLKGNSNLAIQYAEKSLENEKNLWRGAANTARYIVVFNGWLTGNNAVVKKYEPELNERYKETFTNAKKYENETKWVRNLTTQIASKTYVSDVENFIKQKPNFGDARDLENQYNILLGEFYFKNSLYEKSELSFSKLLNASNERDKYLSLRYLIDIYMLRNTNKSKVKNLISVINKFDNDRLKFRKQDLEKKYNL